MKRSGFTLIELSIVLVIIGLLVGGVLMGQSLIRGAALRGVITDVQKYLTAINTFRSKYGGMPGDYAKATNAWGSLGGTGSDATCQNIAATGKATCNGNGDGRVNTNVVSNDEPCRAWQHMANAGLISGQYTGYYGGTVVVGVNLPGTSMGQSTFWYMGTGDAWPATTSTFTQPEGTQIRNAGWTSLAYNAEEAWGIDKKMDDGLPATGRAIAWKGTAAYPCTSNANSLSDANATYNVTNSAQNCYHWFYNAY